MNGKTKWFSECGYGLMIHYLNGLQNAGISPNDPEGKVTSFSDCVDEFDVEAFARDVCRTGAKYVIFTLCQVGKELCAPSETFSRISGYAPGDACSVRDLPFEIGKELGKYGISLLLYFTGDGPSRDPQAAKAFGTIGEGVPFVTEEFVQKWSSVMREYAVRYGKLVRGWWIDGAFDYIGYHDGLLKYYRDAASAGNPDSVIAFNNGVVRFDPADERIARLTGGEKNLADAISALDKLARDGNKEARAILKASDTPKKYRYSVYDDYTAGEASFFGEVPESAEVDGALFHEMSFLGRHNVMPLYGVFCGWAAPGSQYDADFLAEHLDAVNAKGGVLSIDVCLSRDGRIDPAQIALLETVADKRAQKQK